MRVTVTSDDDVHRSARALAQRSGRSLGTVLSELARRGLRPRRPASEIELPVFAVSADAPVIPADRATELL